MIKQVMKIVLWLKSASEYRAVVFLYLFSTVLFSQNPSIRFEHLTIQDGLSQSTVKAILKDSQGFMWFGTFEGLNRYDGLGFKVYKRTENNPKSILGNDIYALCEDLNGNIWIGTSEGLSIYVREKDNFDNDHELNRILDQLRNKQIYRIVRDASGNFWVGTHSWGIYMIQNQTGQIKQFLHDPGNPNSLSSNHITSLHIDHQDDIWIGTKDSGLDLFELKKNSFIHFPYDPSNKTGISGIEVQDITEDTDGNIWVGFQNNGLSCLTPELRQKGQFQNFIYDPDDPEGLGSDVINKLAVDIRGGLWIGTVNGGLDYFNPKTNRFFHYRYEHSDPNSLNNNSIQSIYQDDLKDLWIGTYAGGINVVHQGSQSFMHFLNIPGDSRTLSYNSVWDFEEDADGNIWIATDGGGLNKFDPKTGRFVSYHMGNSNLNVNAILSVCIDRKERIWIGTWAGGISRFDPDKEQFYPFTVENGKLADNSIFDIIEDKQGNLWLATLNSGVIRFNPDNYSYQTFNSNNSDIIYHHIEVLHEDNAGDIYIGSISGLSIYNPQLNQFISYEYNSTMKDTLVITNGFITTFYEVNDSTMWIGTMYGLNKYNKYTREFEHYLVNDGLPGNAIQGITQDKDGYLWISTNNGLSRFDPNQETFENFTQADGLQGNEFIKNSTYRTRNDYLLFGGVNGFNYFDPSRLIKNTVIPPVVITDFWLLNRPVDLSKPDCPLKKHISLIDEITLSHEQNIFSFFFAALNYVSASKNQYAYILEGFDDEWQYVGNTRVAVYTNINPGKYTFRVKGSNNDGVWNEEGTSIRIIITPPFWQTAWFRFFGILSILILIFSLHRLRVASIHKRNMALQSINKKLNIEIQERQIAESKAQASLKEKEVLLKEIHHRVKNNMQVICSLLSLQSSRIEDKELLQTFNESQDRVRAMALIHDRLYKSKDLVEVDFADYVADLIQEIVSSYGLFTKQVDVKTEIDHVGLSIDHAVPCGLVINELLTNALKYAFPDNRDEKNQIFISMNRLNSKVNLVFQDNGVGLPEGFDPDKITSLGIRLVNVLVKQQLHGTLEYTVQNGTQFNISFDYQ